MNGRVDLSGQWLGKSQGYPNGMMMLDTELVRGTGLAHAYLFPDDKNIPSTFVEFRLSDALEFGGVQVPLHPINPFSGTFIRHDEINRDYPDVEHSTHGHISCSLISDQTLEIGWKTPLVTNGRGVLSKVSMPTASLVKPANGIIGWEEFKSVMAQQTFGSILFRGQRRDYPLQTSFHRTKRKILKRYLEEDVQALHRALSSHIDHVFDLEKPQELGAFFNLAQHFGFPTPLLDWTLSPFVAAWFAFKDCEEHRSGAQNSVRVFGLNREDFADLIPFKTLTNAPPHCSELPALALHNERATRQQAVLMLTNLQNVEDYLIDAGEAMGRQYLVAWDIDAACKKEAMNELAMMGITHSTMFPGVESVCKELKENLFS